MKPKVFLSHSSDDKSVVRSLRRALLPFGGQLWLDELELLPGESLFAKIGRQIELSDKVLAFISHASVDSPWVQRELYSCIAREQELNETMIIPVVLDSVSVPAFLNDRLQVRLLDLGFARSTQAILKGLFGHQAVLIAEPSTEGGKFGLKPLRDSIAEHRQAALEGNLLIVFDHHEVSRVALSALVEDEWGEKERFELAWQRCLHLLAALAPALVRLVLRYYSDDVGAPAAADQTIKTVWRLVVLTMLERIRRGGSPEYALSQSPDLFGSAFAELQRVEESRNKRLPRNIGIGTLGELWLAYLDEAYKNCFDIGFRGRQRVDGSHIFDAGHVLIRKCDVRLESLTVFRDTSPDSEFSTVTWVKRVLPYIAADAIKELSFGGRALEEALPRIGLAREDFWYFGLE